MLSALAGGAARAQTAAAGRTYVIVHGAWGGAWAFRRVGALLGAKGHTVYRPELTGLGERVHLATPDVGLATHVEDVVNMMRFEELRDVVLVGHSYGGMVISGVADKVPDRIRHLVYVDAFLPENGESAMDLVGPQGAGWIKGMTANGFIVPAWIKPDQPPPHDVPQPLKTFTDKIALTNDAARKLPGTYILTVDAGKKDEQDDFYAQAERARARKWTSQRLTADHNAQWSAPEGLVALLDAVR
jgi:pimeloyl-ACP methyl ester carboxylesterase